MAGRAATDGRGAKAAHASGRPGIGGPPRLSLPIWRNLGLMAIVNILPIMGMMWAFLEWDDGPRLRRGSDPGILRVALGTLAACAAIAVAAWVVLPIATWLRDYPRWCFFHRSAILWFVPAVCGWVLWLALALVAFIAVFGAIWAVINGFLGVWSRQG